MPHVEFSDDQAKPGKSRRRYSLESFIERISEGAFALCRNLTQNPIMDASRRMSDAF